ncbi:MAG TPA: hypothetical protein VKQ70_01910 [Caulobacteraceae bacterium]|jgi:hypothetical protein|nr:hypothetical protein [Caulobacteraceae bacterium]
MKRALIVVGVFALGLALVACAAGSGESQHAASGGVLSQLLLGFWHGLIAPVMLIVEVIDKFAPHLLPWQVKFYEARGTGVVYDVGFYFGLVGSPLLAHTGWRSRNR